MNNDVLTSCVFVITGLGLLAFYFYLIQKRMRLLSTGLPVEGTIYDLTARSSDESTTSINYPVIRFLTLKQEWVTQIYKVSYPSFILKRGQKVTVYYNPEKPTDFVLNLKIDIWLLRLLLLMGALSILAPIALILFK